MFEDDVFSDRQKKEKELFESISGKQLKYAKLTFLLTFGIIGAIFLILALILFLCGVRDETGLMPSVIFAPMGAFWLLLGVILWFALPKTYNYEKYKKRAAKWGSYNYYDMYIELELQKAKTAALEERISELEGKRR